MKAGHGVQEITPPLGVELSGYGYYLNRKAERVLDGLYAHCAAFEQDGERYALMVCDLIGLTPGIDCEARRLAALKLGTSEDRVMLLSTHTHTGPATGILIGCGEPDGDYMLALPGLIEKAAVRAAADMADVTAFRTVEREIEPIGYNRTMADGPEDHAVRGFVLERSGAAAIAIANYACHPVTMGKVPMVSADYPGRFVRAMADRGVRGLFVNGFCGDIDPVSNRETWGSGNEDVIQAYGERIASVFDGTLEVIKGEPAIRMKRFPLSVRLQEITVGELDTQAAPIYRDSASKPGHIQIVRKHREFFYGRLREEETFTERPMVQTLTIGPVTIIGVPYEAFTETGTAIRAGLPDHLVLAASNAGATLGYLPTEEKIRMGGYEVMASSYIYLRLPIMEGTAERFAQDIIRAIQ